MWMALSGRGQRGWSMRLGDVLCFGAGLSSFREARGCICGNVFLLYKVRWVVTQADESEHDRSFVWVSISFTERQLLGSPAWFSFRVVRLG